MKIKSVMKNVTYALSAAFVIGLSAFAPMEADAADSISGNSATANTGGYYGEIAIYHNVCVGSYEKTHSSSYRDMSIKRSGEPILVGYIDGANTRKGTVTNSELLSYLKKRYFSCNPVALYSDASGTIEFTETTVADGATQNIYVLFDCDACVYKELSSEQTSGAENSEQSSDSGQSSDSEQSSDIVYYQPTEEEIAAMKAAEIEARQKKTVTCSNGTVVKTTMSGVYEVSSLNGTAVMTPNTEVQAAIGLTEDDIKNGANASIYMGNVYTKEQKDALRNAADTNGKTVVSMMLSDMYSIKGGKIEKVNTTSKEVTLFFGLPSHAVSEDRTFSVLCVTPDGNITELKDIDTDSRTVTVDTTVFGWYVLVY